MKKCFTLIAVLLASVLTLWTAGVARAAEEPLRFVHLLQQNGYGDVAVDYLEILAAQPDLPDNVRDVWDLEMAKSLLAAAGDAFDARDKEQLLRQAQEHLAKFIKEKPHHPAAAMAAVAWGDFLVKQALDQLRQAKEVKGKDDKLREKYLSDARKDLVQAREKFRQAEKKFQSRLDELPPLPKPPVKRGGAQRSPGSENRG